MVDPRSADGKVDDAVLADPAIVVALERSSEGPSALGIPRVFLPDDRTPDGRRYVCLRRASGVPSVGTLAVPAIRGRRRSRPGPQPDGGPQEGRASCDASGRYALAIPESASDGQEQVEVLALRRSLVSRLREAVARPFGLRYVALRVSKALPVDVERPVVRCEPKVFDLLGCEPGDRVLLASATVPTEAAADVDAPRGSAPPEARWRTIEGQAFPIAPHDLERRLEEEVEQPDEHHPWLSPRLALGMRIDLPRVFMAAELRQALDVQEGGVVLARREIRSIFGRYFREFGLLVLLAGLALSQLPLPVEDGWLSAAAFLLVAFLLGVVITGASIRSKVRVGRLPRARG